MTQTTAQLRLLQHPLVAHLLTEARDRATTPMRFRMLLEQIGMIMAVEATRDLELMEIEIRTPLEPCVGHKLAQPVTVVSILRAGLGMAEGVVRMLPDAKVGHIGLFRDEEQLAPIQYYEKLPQDVANGPVLLIDPMLATGGSASAAVRLLRSYGCRDLRLLCLVAAPEGVDRLTRDDPTVRILAGALDRELNTRGFILPGLGDAGDRLFGTTAV